MIQANQAFSNSLECTIFKDNKSGHMLIGRLTKNVLQKLTFQLKLHVKIATGSIPTIMTLQDVSSNTTAEDMIISWNKIRLEELSKLQLKIL